MEVESVVNGSAGPGVRTTERDSGLVRVIGPMGLTAAIVNSVVGSGAFLLPGAIAAGAGRFGPLAFLACAVAMGPVVICFAEGGRRVPTSGGPYGYIEAAFGPLAGFIASGQVRVTSSLRQECRESNQPPVGRPSATGWCGAIPAIHANTCQQAATI